MNLQRATLSTTVSCPAVVPMQCQEEPVVRVSIEPRDAKDFSKLKKGNSMLVGGFISG